MDDETGTAGSENIISTCDIGGILCPDGRMSFTFGIYLV